MKVAFVSDTGTGSSPVDLAKEGICCSPLQIIVDGNSLLEQVEISTAEVYQKMSEGCVLKTSLASMKITEELFDQLKGEGYTHIFAIPICTGLSGTINMMRLVAQEKGMEYEFFDCHVTSYVQKYLIEYAKKLHEAGSDFDEIKVQLQRIIDTTNTLIIPSDLKYLQKGGRLTPLAATLGSMLKIKPILQINKTTQGKIDLLQKVRTMTGALKLVVKKVQQDIGTSGEGYDVYVTHVLNQELANELVQLLQIVLPDANYKTDDLVSVVGIHTGPGSIALQYFKRK